MADFIQEIDEELRQERYIKLWQKYGRYLIAGAVAIFVLALGFQGWRQYSESRRIADGIRFDEAQTLLDGDKTAEADRLFAALARDASDGYAVLARLQQAALRVKSGDFSVAVSLYDSIADDTGVDGPLRDAATVLGALHRLDVSGSDTAAIVRRIEPLSLKDGPWRHSAVEVLAIMAFRSGESAKARELFARNADDFDAPPGIRARAAEMLAIIGK